jgi:glycine cleavage system aminomethyltransferase T
MTLLYSAACYDVQGKTMSTPIVTDVTSALAQLNIQGPHSQELLQRLCPTDDLSSEAFPFRTARELSIGYGKALCTVGVQWSVCSGVCAVVSCARGLSRTS